MHSTHNIITSLTAENDIAPAGIVLLLQVPRSNEKKELAAEELFASLHGLLTSFDKRLFGSRHRDRISFEIAIKNKQLGFYVWVPNHLAEFVREQIYAQYPSVHITEAEDYTSKMTNIPVTQFASELRLKANNALPIKTFPSFEVDPLAAITASLSQLGDKEEAWLQFIISPAKETWYRQSERFANRIRSKQFSSAKSLFKPYQYSTETPKLTENELTRAAAAESKSQKLSYEICLRIIYRGSCSTAEAKMRLHAIAASFKQFNTTYLNGFIHKPLGSSLKWTNLFHNRQLGSKPAVLNIEEMASIYHLPHTNVETPNLLWSVAKTAEPPANLPMMETDQTRDISSIALTNFRGGDTVFGLPRSERGRHLYILGQTGVGKSALLELLSAADIASGDGFAVIDPHGDYAQSVLKRVPKDRLSDVVYFNPADIEFPIAFNPMEVSDIKLKTHTCSELIGVLKRMFDSWGPRLEYILRYSILALLDYPNATMLDITRILTDRTFRRTVLSYVDDPVVRNFWLVEFASWNDKFAAEAVAPVLNKVGAFTANPIVRNIIGQPTSSFNIRQIMDERKILIVNLSRGLIGEDNAALLGALLVTKIQMAAMSRANLSAEQRVPFYLYVDEFQNFATESFATILSEARKYGLNLTVANQYIAQMTPVVRDAVFGNVGSIIAFRMSADDATGMQKYFEPAFDQHDLVHMHNRHFAITMTIDGEKARPFSAVTLDLSSCSQDNSAIIIYNSRETYSIKKTQIEQSVRDRYQPAKQSKVVKPEKLTFGSVATQPLVTVKKMRHRARHPKNISALKTVALN